MSCFAQTWRKFKNSIDNRWTLCFGKFNHFEFLFAVNNVILIRRSIYRPSDGGAKCRKDCFYRFELKKRTNNKSFITKQTWHIIAFLSISNMFASWTIPKENHWLNVKSGCICVKYSSLKQTHLHFPEKLKCYAPWKNFMKIVNDFDEWMKRLCMQVHSLCHPSFFGIIFSLFRICVNFFLND